ncbi:MAG TPA: FHA domain-containing protein [Pirellulales bacterium]|nr:FHA domain-containing protein [Pirellulales bacterium]
MEATLVVIGGKTNRSEIKLKLPSVFGRGRDADITIAHPAVSRQHCRLEEVEGALVLRDNNSTNGVYFGKQRVKEMVIRPGDLFSIGPLTFRAEYDHDGEFPDIGDPRPDHQDEATIQFSPGDDLDFSAPTPPDGTPMPGARSKKPPADELDLGLGEPQEAAAGADSGLDFMSDPEPAAAAAEPEANGDDGDDFFSALQNDEPVGASLADSDEKPDGDPLADLGFDEPSDEVEEPAAAKKPAAKHKASVADDPLADLGFDEPSDEVEEPAPAKKPAAKHKAPVAGNESADEMFNFESKESASDALGDDGLADDPLTEDALAEDAFVDNDASAVASADDELDFDLLGSNDEAAGDPDEDTTEVAVSPLKAEKPSVRKPGPTPIADEDEPAADDEIEFDPLDDMPAPAAKSVGALGDLDDLGGDDEPPAKPAADKGKPHKGASAKETKGKEKSGKEKDAKKGWWPFGKGEKKPARKSDERKPAGKHPAAAELPNLEPSAASEPEAFEPDESAAAGDEMPDFFEAEPTPPAKAAKPASAAKPAKPAASAPPAAKAPPPAKKPDSRPAAKPAAATSKPPADEPDLDFSGSGSASKPAEDDDGLNDFFADLGL